jgi:(p)ppGpp synthase/HD superfamily hydrolase
MRLGKRFRDALAYAAKLHAPQLRKGTSIPYVSHLLAVAAIAIEHGADEDEAIAALLHDAVEDQGDEASTTRNSQEIWRQCRSHCRRMYRCHCAKR